MSSSCPVIARSTASRWQTPSASNSPCGSSTVTARAITEPLRDLEPLEALVLDLDRLDRDLVGLGGVLRRRRVLRHTRTMQHELLHRAVVVDVVEEDLDLAAEVRIRHLRDVGDLIVADQLERPALELLVGREPGLERHRF